MNSKAQLFSVDIMIAAAVLTIIIISVFFFWNYSEKKLAAQERHQEMYLLGERALSQLLLTEGTPFNWTTALAANLSSLSSLGLIQQPWILSPQKVYNFSLLPYNNSKLFLGVDGYEFSFRLKSWNTTDYQTQLTTGASEGAAPEVIKITRLALFNNSWTLAEVLLWVNS